MSGLHHSDPSNGPAAGAVLVAALQHFELSAHGRFLRELLAHCAAAIAVREGEQAAAEAVYRVADAVVSRGEP